MMSTHEEPSAGVKPSPSVSTREELLAVVKRSPEAVFAHRREDWIGLFSDDGVVEDPIGSPPAPVANGVLGRFWDTFIAPHEIVFEVHHDYIVGRDVFRDVIIHTRIGPKILIDVPAYLLYQIDATGKTMKVTRMAAHWNLAELSLGALKIGPRTWWPMTRLFIRMIQQMGFSWVGGYLASLWTGIGKAGLKSVTALADGLEKRNAAAISSQFASGATFELGNQVVASNAVLDALAAGSRLSIEKPVCAGWTVSFRYRIEGPTPSAGLALIEFSPADRHIRRARFFPA
jgi:hypothetical protein